MKLVYTGGQAGGIDFPGLGIFGWMPDEVRDVAAEVAEELLKRGDFKVVKGKAKD